MVLETKLRAGSPGWGSGWLFLLGASFLVSCSSFKDEFRLKEEDTAWVNVYLEGSPFSSNAGVSLVELPMSGSEIQIFDRPVLQTTDFVGAQVVQVRYGLALALSLTNRGRHQLARVSGENLGYRLVLAVNSEPVGARRIDGMIQDGVLFTFVEIDDSELEELARKINRTINYAARRGK